MTGDLFSGVDSARNIELPGASLKFHQSFLSPHEADAAFAYLLAETDWRESDVFVWGKWHKQPRLVAWHGDKDASYSYSGSKMDPTPWTKVLSEMRSRVENECGARFNSVLLNLYRDGNDRMGWHSDNEPELGEKPTIASVSLGATRDLLFKHRSEKKLGIHRVPLTSGSLLVMAGDTQHSWLHAINNESRPTAKRINLTFRLVRGK